MKFIFRTIIIALLALSCNSNDASLSSENKLLTFSIKEIGDNFIISPNNQVEVSLLDEIDLKNITSYFTVSPNAKVFVGTAIQTSGSSKNDYSKPLVLTIIAEDGSKATYTVIITFGAKIRIFSIVELPNIPFVINKDFSITAGVPSGTNLNNLTAKFELTNETSLHVGSTVQVSGQTKNNFNQPLVYDLKLNGVDNKKYTIKITVEANNLPKANAGEDKTVLIPVGSNNAIVNLDGSNSTDLEAPIVAYEWKSGNTILGTTAVLNANLAIGTHTIELKVTDSSGESATDTVIIDVKNQGVYTPIDNNATLETKNLYTNIASIANSGKFIFGQEFPLSFQLNSLDYNLNTSDCKDVSGDHPGVYGIDPHYMLYKSAAEKQLHIDEAKHAYANGSIVTFDFHQQSKTDHKIYYNDITSSTDKSLMYDIVNDKNGSRTWFFNEIDQIISIINNDLGFPVVFRPYHEMDGDWFWWGTKATNHNAQLYIDLYRLTVDHIKSKTNLVLFGWTPNQKMNSSYYPGDAYVDIVGIDAYSPSASTLKTNLIELSKFAYDHNKVAVLSETGKQDYINTSPTFWTASILKGIEDGGNDIRIGWVLAWFNAPWETSQSGLFIPNSNSPTQAKDDFKSFHSSSTTLFQTEVKALNIYK
nr:glycosyl hydrolase [uncultured Flavobacterium sp.]